jgi:FSR family fosmidomycin resistance protein-like MFS transporter
VTDIAVGTATPRVETTVYPVLLATCLCHFINDVMQSLLSALYPMLKEDYGLDFWQIGLLTLTFQVTASLLQPMIGIYTDKKPMPQSLPVSSAATIVGLLLLAYSTTYPMLIAGAAMIGIGSAIFHPEASRVARMASGGRFGLAQSVFQVGGNFGSAMGPLLAAFVVVQRGQASVAWFTIMALVSMIVLRLVGNWYGRYQKANAGKAPPSTTLPIAKNRVVQALVILTLLVFSKHVYMASLSSYYTFFVIERFGLSVQEAQIMLFLFLGAAAVGTILGGPIGDRIGAKSVIWLSILGVLPFTLALPYADLYWSGVLTIIIGLVMASAFPAIVVFAQELVPGRVGMIGGIFFGLAFGMGGLGAAALGILADRDGIAWVYHVCSYLPLIGLLTVFLPSMKELRAARR